MLECLKKIGDCLRWAPGNMAEGEVYHPANLCPPPEAVFEYRTLTDRDVIVFGDILDLRDTVYDRIGVVTDDYASILNGFCEDYAKAEITGDAYPYVTSWRSRVADLSSIRKTLRPTPKDPANIYDEYQMVQMYKDIKYILMYMHDIGVISSTSYTGNEEAHLRGVELVNRGYFSCGDYLERFYTKISPDNNIRRLPEYVIIDWESTAEFILTSPFNKDWKTVYLNNAEYLYNPQQVGTAVERIGDLWFWNKPE